MYMKTIESRKAQRNSTKVFSSSLPRPAMVVEYAGGKFIAAAVWRKASIRSAKAKPGATPAPDGRVQAPHLNVTVFARGLLRHLVTRMYFPDEAEANATDPALNLVEPARRETLIAKDCGGVLHFDIRLQGERETVFLAI